MSYLSMSALAVTVLISTAVCASGAVQTGIVTARPGDNTALPSGAYTVKTILSDMQISNRNVAPDSGSPLIRLTPCAQAILGCCAPEVEHRQNCFEQIGCGPHVFGDPCDKAFMNQALGGAERFYTQFMPNTVDTKR